MIEVVREPTDEVHAALARLVPQLSGSAAQLSWTDFQSIVASDAVTLLVARDEQGSIVGTLSLVVVGGPAGVRASIEDVVVEEAARGKGIGAELVTEAIELARASGAREVDLTSRPTREAANRLYERLGFELRSTNAYRYRL